MSQHYDETFKKKIVRLRIEEGRSVKSIIEKYGISKSSVIKWCNKFCKKCQNSNAYYNFHKDMKSAYRAKKQLVLREIATIYYEHNGIDDYRSMQVFLARKQIHLSATLFITIYEQGAESSCHCPA